MVCFGCLVEGFCGFLMVGFGEASPETKAATNLHDFFTYLAVKIVLAQLEVIEFVTDEVLPAHV